MPEYACLNGQHMPLAEAKVPVNDRGYLFGDGVYEVVRTYNGKLFRLEQHLDRLDQSLSQVRITPNWDRDTLITQIHQTCANAGFADSKIYIQVTRGVAPRNHPFPNATPTTLITASEIHPLSAEQVRGGVFAITTPDIRWGRCDIKSLNLLPNILARQLAQDAGAFEALFVSEDERLVREAASSNVFAVIGGTVVTPPLGTQLLAGVSRAYLLELAAQLDIPVQERSLTLSELMAADEVFLTGTTIEVIGVVRVDDQAIANGQVGPLSQRLLAHFKPQGLQEAV